VRMYNISKITKDINGYIFDNNEFLFNKAAMFSTAYPVDLSFTLNRENIYYEPKDCQGIPVKIYKSVGAQYNPTRIAAYGLAHYNQYLATGSSDSREQFKKVADWFMHRSSNGLWTYEFSWGDLDPPWISAMAQGEGISVLVRAWHLSGDERYLERALMATEPFSREISDGGVLAYLDGRDPFLEEYPTPNPSHVLNGFLFAVIGLADIERMADRTLPTNLGVDRWVEVLGRHLHEWDLGFWSAYDLSLASHRLRNPTTVSYHRLHISQLHYLGEYARSRVLLETAKKWDKYRERFSSRIRAMLMKFAYRAIVKAER